MKALLFFLLLLVVPLGQAHDSESAQTIIVDGYQVHLDIVPFPVLTGQDTAFSFQVSQEGESIAVENTIFEVLREQYALTEDNNTYTTNFTYDSFGQQEITFSWNDGEEHQAIFQVDVAPTPPSNNAWIYWVIAGGILIGLLVVGVQKKKINKKDAIMYSVGVIIVLGLGFSVFSYNQWEGNQGCLLQLGENEYVLHCHQELNIEICGEERELTWEAGDLDRAHTHKSSTRIHWHPPNTVTEPEELQTLRNLGADLSLQLTEDSIQLPDETRTYTAGEDDCNTGTPGVLEVFITEDNSEERQQITPFLDVGLPDEAKVEIIYK